MTDDEATDKLLSILAERGPPLKAGDEIVELPQRKSLGWVAGMLRDVLNRHAWWMGGYRITVELDRYEWYELLSMLRPQDHYGPLPINGEVEVNGVKFKCARR